MLAPSILLYRHPLLPVKNAARFDSRRLLLEAGFPQRLLASATSFQEWRKAATKHNGNMATPSKVHLTVHDTGIVGFKPQTAETAAKTSELLQENHDVLFPITATQRIHG
jgi:hypothetical protein